MRNKCTVYRGAVAATGHKETLFCKPERRWSSQFWTGPRVLRGPVQTGIKGASPHSVCREGSGCFFFDVFLKLQPRPYQRESDKKEKNNPGLRSVEHWQLWFCSPKAVWLSSQSHRWWRVLLSRCREHAGATQDNCLPLWLFMVQRSRQPLLWNKAHYKLKTKPGMGLVIQLHSRPPAGLGWAESRVGSHSSPKVLVSSTAVSIFSYSIEKDGYGGRSSRLKQVWALERDHTRWYQTFFSCRQIRALAWCDMFTWAARWPSPTSPHRTCGARCCLAARRSLRKEYWTSRSQTEDERGTEEEKRRGIRYVLTFHLKSWIYCIAHTRAHLQESQPLLIVEPLHCCPEPPDHNVVVVVT